MIHKIRLVNFAFEKIKNKEKDIEVRLKDEEDASIMNKFYTKEEEEKYGVIGIEINRSL